MRLLNFAVPCLFALTFLVGCASTTNIAARQPYMVEKIDRPDRIIVHDFVATPSDVSPEPAIAVRSAEHRIPQTAEQIETGRTLGAQVAQNLVAEIRGAGLPAVQAAGEPAPQAGDLVIRGYFISIDQGSDGERVLVGFSSETADLRTVVEGYLMTYQGLRRLETRQLDSGNIKTPGMLAGFVTLAATGNPLYFTAGGTSKLKGERSGPATIGDAAQGTAKEIADLLRVEFREQGWI